MKRSDFILRQALKIPEDINHPPSKYIHKTIIFETVSKVIS